MDNQVESEKILSLQALRGLAFLGIFFVHTRAPVSWATLGVSTFFVLSGCLLYYRNGKQELPCSLKKNMLFARKKMKKLYPLHIATMCLTVIMYLIIWKHNGFTMKDVAYMLAAIGLNITLLQSWVPYNPMNVSLNGVAWFLSSAMFLYFMFPYIRRWMKKRTNTQLLISYLLFLSGELLVCIVMTYILGSESPVYKWLTYCFPVFRLSDFFAGCCLGKCWAETGERENVSFAKASVCEILVFLITTGVHLWSAQMYPDLLSQAANNGTTLFQPFAVMWVWLFIHKRGILTKILTNRFTVFLGDISPHTFLIHFVIVQYFTTIKGLFRMELSYWENLFFIAVQFVLTILTTVIYRNFKIVIDKHRSMIV